MMDWGSSSPSGRPWKYDVFVSFRGKDTRRGFTSHLLAALKREGINTFLDDAEKGMELEYMLQAIEKSQILIAILSRGYAESSWCLDELAKIMEFHGSREQTVRLVFYHVKQSDVKDPTGLYREAFARHEHEQRVSPDKVKLWREVLNNLPEAEGREVENEPESRVIEFIVNDVISILDKQLCYFQVGLVGMESRKEELKSRLNLESNDVQVVGIYGMTGIGKTTLAGAVYDDIFRKFDAACFLSNVSDVSKRHNGLSHLQEKLIRHTLGLEDLKIRGDQEGIILLRTRLRRLKVLLVLDDVDHSQQLEKLAGNIDWFGNGSRLIITTRDERVLNWYRLGMDKIYKVKLLNWDEARELFHRKAFKCDYVREGYEELTSRVLEYAEYLPSAIESLATSLREHNVSEWNGVMETLQKVPSQWIMRDHIRKDFDGLSFREKHIVLDIACFFVGKTIDYVKEILKDYRFDYGIEITNLKKKSLVSTMSNPERISMHNILQKVAQEIIRRESPEAPEKRSRLWHYDDLQNVNEKNIANVEAIVLNREDSKGRPLRAAVFSKMDCLKLLIIQNVRFSGKLDYLSNSLIYLSWDKYPFTDLPQSFEPKGLVKLFLHESNITQLWSGKKKLPNLRMMSLRDSKGLIMMKNLRIFPNLESLDLKGCTALHHIDPSIAILEKLTSLILKGCTSLASIPTILFRRRMQDLNLAGCTKLAKWLDSIKGEYH